MKTFEYKALDRSGRRARGLVEAPGPKQARERLAGEGLLVETLVATGRRAVFPPAVRERVYRELAALLGAGMPMLKALDMLVASPQHAAARALLAGVRDRVREGMALAAAIEAASASVTPFERALVEAAERSGAVPPMLERMAAFLEEQRRLRDRIASALIYPVIVVGAGLCVAALMLGLLLPRARDILAAGGVALPPLTRAMLALADGLWPWGLVLVGSLCLLVGAAGRRAWRDAARRERLDARLLRLPLIGSAYACLAALRFARTLAILLGGGVQAIEAAALSARATGSPSIAAQSREALERVRHGAKLSDALRGIAPLAGLAGWIEIGESGGGMENLLEGAGKRYQEEWDRRLARALALLEPVLILLIGGFVLLVTLAVLLPVLSLSRLVGG